jgi:hypothetical protein
MYSNVENMKKDENSAFQDFLIKFPSLMSIFCLTGNTSNMPVKIDITAGPN